MLRAIHKTSDQQNDNEIVTNFFQALPRIDLTFFNLPIFLETIRARFLTAFVWEGVVFKLVGNPAFTIYTLGWSVGRSISNCMAGGVIEKYCAFACQPYSAKQCIHPPDRVLCR